MLFYARIVFVGMATLWASATSQGPDHDPGNVSPVAVEIRSSAARALDIRDQQLDVVDARLAFSGDMRLDLLALVPSDRKVLLGSLGDIADQAVATDIQHFLEARGYDVVRVMTKTVAPAPRHKIALTADTYEYVLPVAPSVTGAPGDAGAGAAPYAQLR